MRMTNLCPTHCQQYNGKQVKCKAKQKTISQKIPLIDKKTPVLETFFNFLYHIRWFLKQNGGKYGYNTGGKAMARKANGQFVTKEELWEGYCQWRDSAVDVKDRKLSD